jgi:hypothetical protein
MRVVVHCKDISTFVARLPMDCLPYGFLERVTVIGPPDCPRMPDFSLALSKTNGVRKSGRVAAAEGAYVTYGDLANDNDAGDPAYEELLHTTGHNLKFRMIPGVMVGALILEFYGWPPKEFWVVFHGANTVPPSALDTLASRLAARERVDLGFKPVHPRKRREIAEAAAAAALAAGVDDPE